MSFAKGYLSKNNLFKSEIICSPDAKTGIIVVIPSYNESLTLKSVESLINCTPPSCYTEIIVVVNSSEKDIPEVIERNNVTIKEINERASEINRSDLKIFAIEIKNVPYKYAGVGFARKTGMDEAVFRFSLIDKPDGVIVAYDADCTCEPDYLLEIEKKVLSDAEINIFIARFEHPIKGTEFSAETYHAVLQYEMHLRYLVNAFRYTGFPYSYHTIGSCMGVKAAVYAEQGGMNRRKAGEDFYFLHKLFHLGGLAELNQTCVYPSPRPSDRVPFGTGKAIRKMLDNNENQYLTYNFNSFRDIKKLFDWITDLYNQGKSINDGYQNLPESVRLFDENCHLKQIIEESLANSTNENIFYRRFYNRFNAFQIIKFLNFVHENKIYEKRPVNDESNTLLCELHHTNNMVDDVELLNYLRQVDSKR
jgi:hypothetical protein